ncbi:helix-turn-helix domain-containing protein [Brevibacillus agri]|uniref:helix-turn-helix domain-containing protein n=2 Tax=Brevibacillus agri TaxID=51101 RepID=UPI002867F1B1|nr:helix-turn-helix transcriptional regulator [Brevibacillus agri]
MKPMKHTEIKQQFGAAIRKLRMEQKMTQEELAGRTGLHRTYISEVERGERNVSLENIVKLANALRPHVSSVFLLIEKGE